MKRNTIRGVRIERVPYEPRGGVVENLRYSIDVFDANGNLIEVLGRLADLVPAREAFRACVAKYPDKSIFLRHNALVIARSDRPDG